MPSPDWKSVTDRAVDFIRRQVADAEANGVVFGLSGGIDSSVTAHLCSRAMGNRCLALVMPNLEFTPDSETTDGLAVADQLSIRHKVIPISGISNLISARDVADDFLGQPEQMKRTIGNLNARIRAVVLYYEAQKSNCLVVGTDDKSEYLIGYFTKYGDGACDMLPIASLHKTQVTDLGRFLGVPQNIIDKLPSPHLWKDHRASEEIGMGYEMIERILDAMKDSRDVDTIASELDISPEMVRRIDTLNRLSEHKRSLPPIAHLL